MLDWLVRCQKGIQIQVRVGTQPFCERMVNALIAELQWQV